MALAVATKPCPGVLDVCQVIPSPNRLTALQTDRHPMMSHIHICMHAAMHTGAEGRGDALLHRHHLAQAARAHLRQGLSVLSACLPVHTGQD